MTASANKCTRVIVLQVSLSLLYDYLKHLGFVQTTLELVYAYKIAQADLLDQSDKLSLNHVDKSSGSNKHQAKLEARYE